VPTTKQLVGVAEASIEAISLIAEVAVGLAGFAGVAVVLGRGPGRWGEGDSLRISLLLGAAFTALFASLITTGSHWAGAGTEVSVRLGAGALLAGQIYWLAFPARRIGRLEASEQALFDLRLAAFIRLVGFSSCAAQAVVLSGFGGRLTSGLFVYGLICCLAYAALGFFRFMFRRPSSG
jgi:hypothetical protein